MPRPTRIPPAVRLSLLLVASLLGLALAVAMAGGLGSLFMMSRQRDAELAMLGIIGATPGERTRTALLEAVMITVTAALLGVVMLAAAYAHLALGVSALGMQWAAAVPAGPFLATVAVTGGITAAAPGHRAAGRRIAVRPVLVGG